MDVVREMCYDLFLEHVAQKDLYLSYTLFMLTVLGQ